MSEMPVIALRRLLVRLRCVGYTEIGKRLGDVDTANLVGYAEKSIMSARAYQNAIAVAATIAKLDGGHVPGALPVQSVWDRPP
jgi:hypothetical protein